MAKPPGFFQTLLPHSLRRQFILAVSAIAILIVAGGLTAVQSLRVSAETSRQLTEKRLELMHDAQNLVQRTQLIEHESQRLLAADSLDFMQSRYIEVIAQLESLDALVARLAESICTLYPTLDRSCIKPVNFPATPPILSPACKRTCWEREFPPTLHR